MIRFTRAMISAEQQGCSLDCSLGFRYNLCLYLPSSLFGVGRDVQDKKGLNRLEGPALSLR